jgi:hypothetical protein
MQEKGDYDNLGSVDLEEIPESEDWYSGPPQQIILVITSVPPRFNIVPIPFPTPPLLCHCVYAGKNLYQRPTPSFPPRS